MAPLSAKCDKWNAIEGSACLQVVDDDVNSLQVDEQERWSQALGFL